MKILQGRGDNGKEHGNHDIVGIYGGNIEFWTEFVGFQHRDEGEKRRLLSGFRSFKYVYFKGFQMCTVLVDVLVAYILMAAASAANCNPNLAGSALGVAKLLASLV